jgi:alpha-L-fucosidase
MPPDRRGVIHESDVKALKGFRTLLDTEFKSNLALQAKVEASSYRGDDLKYSPANSTDGNTETYWTTNDDVTSGHLEIDLGESKLIKYIALQEYIKLGQRVKSFTIEIWKDSAWQEVAAATTIGYKRIIKIEPVDTDKIRIKITSSRACPLLSNVEVF